MRGATLGRKYIVVVTAGPYNMVFTVQGPRGVSENFLFFFSLI